MNRRTLYISFRFLIGLVWLVNGLFCKVLGWVPRHEQIVARILGEEYAGSITVMIGLAEVLLACWVWSAWRSRVTTVLQMALVATMNVLEFFLSPELLLWGHYNALYATLFIAMVAVTEWGLKEGSLSKA
ncbi:MAG: DoxX-like family protein [Verrucomicrobiales bacterium]|nr:DoxX-like family protein [Verrucomicrobiales bacterium]